MYYVLAIAGRPVVLSNHLTRAEALRAFAPLECPSLVVGDEGGAVQIIATRGLAPAQVDEALLEAVRRVCTRVEA
jgi:hypothetical protein